MACPIKTSSEYIKLKKQVGKELADYTWFAYNESYPQMYTNTELRNVMKIPYKTFESGVIIAANTVRRYNFKNGTAHHFTKTKIGESLQYKIEFIPNYLPVNIEKQRQRDLARGKVNNLWMEFNSKNFTELTPSDIALYNKVKSQVESQNYSLEEIEKTEETSTSSKIITNEVFGIDEYIPEIGVHILGNNQYEANGEIYPTYADALVAAGSDPFGFEELSFLVPEQPQNTIDAQLQDDLENMYPTLKLLDYLYDFSTKRLNKDKFYKEASSFMIRMKSDGFSNNDIIEAIKCI